MIHLRLIIMSIPGMPAPKQIQGTEATAFSKENFGSATFMLVFTVGFYSWKWNTGGMIHRNTENHVIVNSCRVRVLAVQRR